jgi:hypothetical protein
MRILSILSLLLFPFPIISTNVCIIVYLDLFCAGSTHLQLSLGKGALLFVCLSSLGFSFGVILCQG